MSWLKKHIVSLVLFLLTTLAGTVWAVFQKGAQLEFKESVVEVLLVKIESKDFMDDVMTSDYMEEYKAAEKLKNYNEILTKVDADQIDYFELISGKTGLTKQALIDSISKRVKQVPFNDHRCIKNTKKYSWKPTASF